MVSRCAACGLPIVWRRTLANRWTPDNLDGTTHWASCARRELIESRLRASGRGEGEQLEFLELQRSEGS